MAHQVFICHSSKDKLIADAACAALEAQSIRCWIAPRDVLPGQEWGKSIIDALAGCEVVLLVFSQNANESGQVRREVERAVGKGKIIVPFRIEDVQPSDAMEFAIFNVHWLDALTPPMERRLGELCESIAVLLKLEPESIWHHAVVPDTPVAVAEPVKMPEPVKVPEPVRIAEPVKAAEPLPADETAVPAESVALPQEPARVDVPVKVEPVAEMPAPMVRTCPQCSKPFSVLNRHCPVDGAALSEPHDPGSRPPVVDQTPGKIVLYARPKNDWGPLNDAMGGVHVKVGNRNFEMKWGQRSFDVRPGLQYVQVGVRSEFMSGLKSVAELTMTLNPGEVKYVRYSTGLGPMNRGNLEVNPQVQANGAVRPLTLAPGMRSCGGCHRTVPMVALFCPGCGQRQ